MNLDRTTAASPSPHIVPTVRPEADGTRRKRFLWLFLILGIGIVLTGCSGRRLAASSWPETLVADEIAYIAFQQIFAVDPHLQNPEWEFPSSPDDSGPTFYAAPAVTDGLLVGGGYDNVLYGIDRNTRQVEWNFHGASDRYIASPVVLGDTVFAATAGNELFSLNLEELDRLGTVEKADEARHIAEEAAVNWEFTAGHGIWASPLVTTDTLYLTSMDHHVYALETETGRKIWDKELPGAMAGAPLLSADGRTLFVGNFDNRLYALDAATGEERWETVEAENWIWGSPTLAGETLFFGDLAGYLYEVNPGTGELLWKEKVADAIRGGPIYDPESGRLYITGRRESNPGGVGTLGVVLALDPATHRTFWEERTEQAIYTSPALSGDSLLVTPAQGDVLMLVYNAETGVTQWRYIPNPED